MNTYLKQHAGNGTGTMETETIQKNGARPKSHTSRVNAVIAVTLICVALILAVLPAAAQKQAGEITMTTTKKVVDLYYNMDADVVEIDWGDGNSKIREKVFSSLKYITHTYKEDAPHTIRIVAQNLTSLSCHDNQLTALDVSRNTALGWLSCENNQLTALDVSNNTALLTLKCANNQLTDLAVGTKRIFLFEHENNRLEEGDATMLYKLGAYYEKTASDAKKAVYWYDKAKAQGYEDVPTSAQVHANVSNQDKHIASDWIRSRKHLYGFSFDVLFPAAPGEYTNVFAYNYALQYTRKFNPYLGWTVSLGLSTARAEAYVYNYQTDEVDTYSGGSSTSVFLLTGGRYTTGGRIGFYAGAQGGVSIIGSSIGIAGEGDLGVFFMGGAFRLGVVYWGASSGDGFNGILGARLVISI